MIKVEIQGMAALQAHLAGMQKQVKFAAAVALTRTAQAAKVEVTRLMPSELDRPKPGTTRALRVERATKDNLTAVVRLNQRGEGVPAQEFIGHNVTGGRRGMKRSEIMLRAAGILPEGMYTIPGKEATLDAYGNMSKGQIVAILSYFRTFGVATYKDGSLLNSSRMNRAQKTKARAVYFLVPVRDRKLGLYPGIWKRAGRELQPVLMFVKPGTHRKLVKMYETGTIVTRRDFNRLFDAAFADAMRTAR
jgi:hypothetical protein